MLSYIGQGVGGAAFNPDCFSGFDLNLRRAFAFDVAAQIQVGDGYDYVWSVVMVFGKDAAGIELQVGGADTVFDEENVQGAAVQDVEAAFFIPLVRELRLVVFMSSTAMTWKGLSERFFAVWAKGPGTNTVSPS